jgi:hypothetical protein
MTEQKKIFIDDIGFGLLMAIPWVLPNLVLLRLYILGDMSGFWHGLEFTIALVVVTVVLGVWDARADARQYNVIGNYNEQAYQLLFSGCMSGIGVLALLGIFEDVSRWLDIVNAALLIGLVPWAVTLSKFNDWMYKKLYKYFHRRWENENSSSFQGYYGS